MDLTPKWKEVEIQIYVLGIRKMHRGVGAVHKPFVSIHFPNGHNLATAPSNLPSPNSPNFCQFFTVKQQLPAQSIFSPAIRVAVRDSKGSILKTAKWRKTKTVSESGSKRLGWAFVELQDFLGDAVGASADGWTQPNEFKKRKAIQQNEAILERMAAAEMAAEQTEKEREHDLQRAAMRKQMEFDRGAAGDAVSDHDANRSFYGSSDDDDAANTALFQSWMPTLFGLDDENNGAVFSDDGGGDSMGWSASFDDEQFRRKLEGNDEGEKERAMSWDDLIGLYRVPALRERDYFKEGMEHKLDLNPFIITEIEGGQSRATKHKIADLKCLIRIKEDVGGHENSGNDDGLFSFYCF